MNKLFFLLSMALLPASMSAQKSLYIPNEWKYSGDSLLYKESDPDNKYTWSKSRSKESENFIVYWDKGYGNTNPSNADGTYRIDIDYLLQQAEAFYKVNIEQLGFANTPDSYVNKYKSMILLNHTTTWTCYGAGYDFTVPALWLNPSPCQPVGHSVAHEVGHSFQYTAYSDASKGGTKTAYVGFHDPIGNGAGIWEQCAQWQGLISFPSQMYDQSIGLFRNTHNYAFTHEWHRYQSYWFLYYLAQYYNDQTIVSQIWKHEMPKKAPDFNEVLMDLKGLSVEELYKMYFDYACRLVTWDLDACKPYRDNYIGDFNYRCCKIGDHNYQVALASCPQSTGFNVIPLQVPEAGTTVTTSFTAPRLRGSIKLAEADPAEYFNGDRFVSYGKDSYVYNGNTLNRGFRIGYVVLLKDGTRQYINDGQIHCLENKTVTEDIQMTVPENVDRMWLVVSPAPKKYISHLWDEDITKNDDMWPYSFKLDGTDIGSHAITYVSPTIDGRSIEDAKLTYDVYFPASSSYYSGTSVTVSGEANAMVGTAFQMNMADVTDRIVNYSASGPSDGQIMFYAQDRGGALTQKSPTANGYGYWYAANGSVSTYAYGYTFSEFSPSSMTFSIGQYPGKNKNGDKRTIRQALKYRKSATESATVSFVFNIHFDASKTGAELSQIEYDADKATAVEAVKTLVGEKATNVYNLVGQKVKAGVDSQKSIDSLPGGIYVVKGKKILVK